MLRSLNKLKTYRIGAIDSEIGPVEDFYFDDGDWVIRYVAANTGNWLQGRHVLIAPEAIGIKNWEDAHFPALVSKEQIENSPVVEIDKPITREKELELCQYYEWTNYWTFTDPTLSSSAGTLQSARGVIDSTIDAVDGEIGKVYDFIIEDSSWIVRYLVVDTAKWLTGRKVLISPFWVKGVNWEEQTVSSELTKDEIKNSPEYDPLNPIERTYETELYKHYGKPGYWR